MLTLDTPCSHRTDAIVGYVVYRTVEHGVPQEISVPVAYYPSANDYASAIAMARAYRTNGMYAIVRSVYACGCEY